MKEVVSSVDTNELELRLLPQPENLKTSMKLWRPALPAMSCERPCYHYVKKAGTGHKVDECIYSADRNNFKAARSMPDKGDFSWTSKRFQTHEIKTGT